MVTMLMKGNQLEHSKETQDDEFFNYSLLSFTLGTICFAYLMLNEGFAGFLTGSLPLYGFMLFSVLGVLFFGCWILVNTKKGKEQDKKPLL